MTDDDSNGNNDSIKETEEVRQKQIGVIEALQLIVELRDCDSASVMLELWRDLYDAYMELMMVLEPEEFGKKWNPKTGIRGRKDGARLLRLFITFVESTLSEELVSRERTRRGIPHKSFIRPTLYKSV
jgi:hypothetical protein